MKSLWPMIQAIHRVVTSRQSRGTPRSSCKDALSAAWDWKHPVAAVFAGSEGLQSVTAMTVISAAAVSNRARAGPDHPTAPTKSVRKNRACVPEGSRTSSLHIIPKNNKIKSPCVSVFLLTFRPLKMQLLIRAIKIVSRILRSSQLMVPVFQDVTLRRCDSTYRRFGKSFAFVFRVKQFEDIKAPRYV
jgi:hypothetical protein